MLEHRPHEALDPLREHRILTLDHEEGEVSHPLLLQRVELRFDAGIPEFTLAESDDNPEVYTPLLRQVGLDGHVIQSVNEAVAREHFHRVAMDQMRPLSRKYDDQEHDLPTEWVDYWWNEGRKAAPSGDASKPTDGFIQVCVQAEELCFLSRNIGTGRSLTWLNQPVPPTINGLILVADWNDRSRHRALLCGQGVAIDGGADG